MVGSGMEVGRGREGSLGEWVGVGRLVHVPVLMGRDWRVADHK